MKILLSGSSGLIGTYCRKYFESQGHEVFRLVRAQSNRVSEILFDIEQGYVDGAQLPQVDAVVHLAGESVAQRWTTSARQRIRDSRVKGTALLASALAALPVRPAVIISASAIGYYGDRGKEILTEASKQGSGFLPEVCAEWESALSPAQEAGLRTVSLRLGLVLSADGGALARMLLPFQLGIGGAIGSGQQYMSWICIDDVAGALQLAINNKQLTGPVNLVSPYPVTNADFTQALGRVLHRPCLFPLPGTALKLLFGSAMASEMLLSSTRVLPAKLQTAGYEFQYPHLEAALLHLLRKSPARAQPAAVAR